jgi:hypothetical protein
MPLLRQEWYILLSSDAADAAAVFGRGRRIIYDDDERANYLAEPPTTIG